MRRHVSKVRQALRISHDPSAIVRDREVMRPALATARDRDRPSARIDAVLYELGHGLQRIGL